MGEIRRTGLFSHRSFANSDDVHDPERASSPLTISSAPVPLISLSLDIPINLSIPKYVTTCDVKWPRLGSREVKQGPNGASLRMSALIPCAKSFSAVVADAPGFWGVVAGGVMMTNFIYKFFVLCEL